MNPRSFRTASLAILLFVPGLPARAQSWSPVPTVNFANLNASQFADNELEVPYYLRHFAQVANAVVETGPNRGFLNIAVNRNVADNQPYNARIMENQLSLAYFYTANRPWNPYRGNSSVRVRLEAMLDRWTRIQNQPGSGDGNFDGLFAEYNATGWNLAATGFGVMHAAEAIDLLRDSGLPFDATILENARISLRRALWAMFTRSDMRELARQYSNQFNGSYHAALIYLENWPDAALDDKFKQAVQDSATQDKSPAGFYFEEGGPDFGYSSVHERNDIVALPRLRNRTDLLPTVIAADTSWNQWLASNYVLQPGLASRAFLANAGLNTRTNHAVLTPQSRPLSEWVQRSRIFSLTDSEYASAVNTRRAQLQAEFGQWGPLSVPNSESYVPSFVFGAVRPLNTWHPTAAERTAAEADLGCFEAGSVNRQFHDPRPVTVTTVKRPAYYAIVNTGRIRVPRQVYGLGLLWHPAFGVALQAVSNPISSNSWMWGTRRTGVAGTYETSDIMAAVTVAGSSVIPISGVRTLPPGDVGVTYSLSSYGQKTIQLSGDNIQVALTHSGSFTELLPLAHATDATISTTTNRLVLQRPNGSSFLLEILSPGATFSVGVTSSLVSGLVRRQVSINASGSLSYRITLSNQPPPAIRTMPDFVSASPGTAVRIDVLKNDSSATGSSLSVTGASFAQSSALSGLPHGAAILDATSSTTFPTSVINTIAPGASLPGTVSALPGFLSLTGWRDPSRTFAGKGSTAQGVVNYHLRSDTAKSAVRFEVNANTTTNPSSGGPTSNSNLVGTADEALYVGAVGSYFGEVTISVGRYSAVSQNSHTLGFRTADANTGRPFATRAVGFVVTGIAEGRSFTAEFRGVHGQILATQTATAASANSRIFFGRDAGTNTADWINSVVLRGDNNFANVGLDDFGFTPIVDVSPGNVGMLSFVDGLPVYTSPLGFLGTVRFRYTVTDGTVTAEETVTVTIDSPPVAVGSVTASTWQEPNTPSKVLDGITDASISRWSGFGDGATLTITLASRTKISAMNISTFEGSIRRAIFDVQTSEDGVTWTTVFSGSSSGTTTDLERISLAPTWGRYVRIVGHGYVRNDGLPGALWNSFGEVQVIPGLNSHPVALPIVRLMRTNTSMNLDFAVLGNDPDDGPFPLNVSEITTPANGAVQLLNGAIHYTPNPGYRGGDSFSYTLSDGDLTSSASVSVIVGTPSSFNDFKTLYFNATQQLNPGISGENANPDSDSVQNLFEYAFASDPWIPGDSLLPSASVVDDRLTLSFYRSRFASDVIYTVEGSSNLIHWTEMAQAIGTGSWENLAGAQSIKESDADSATTHVVISDAITTGLTRFFRLRISLSGFEEAP